MKIAPHIHRIGNDIVAMYLVDAPDGITLIDAGFTGHWRDLKRELTVLGKQPSDIKGLILTHADRDHIGFAERLRREHGVPVYLHAAEVAQARTGHGRNPSVGPMSIGPTLALFAYALRKGALRSTNIERVVEIADGDVLPLPGAPVIIGMPGHSPGSVAVHVPLADAVIVGDALATRHLLTGRRGPQLAPFSDDLGAAAASLDRLAALDATWVLPGHGAPWNGSAAKAVEAARAARSPVRQPSV